MFHGLELILTGWTSVYLDFGQAFVTHENVLNWSKT